MNWTELTYGVAAAVDPPAMSARYGQQLSWSTSVFMRKNYLKSTWRKNNKALSQTSFAYEIATFISSGPTLKLPGSYENRYNTLCFSKVLVHLNCMSTPGLQSCSVLCEWGVEVQALLRSWNIFSSPLLLALDIAVHSLLVPSTPLPVLLQQLVMLQLLQGNPETFELPIHAWPRAIPDSQYTEFQEA